MVLLRRRVHGTLLFLLMVSSGLSGCFDGDDDADPAAAPAVTWRPGDAPLPVAEYERLYGTPAPESCEGCIPLATRPTEPLPPPPAPEPVRIPVPHIGDRALVHGEVDWSEGPLQAILPLDHEGRYRMVLEVHEEDEAHVGIQLTFTNGVWHPRPIEVTEANWVVALDSRTVTNGTMQGHAWVDGRLEPLGVQIDTRPTLETLFWLGAHIWGRTLVEEERFTSHWLVPAGDAVRLRFDYRVAQVARDGVLAPSSGHHGHDLGAAGVPDARVDVRVTASGAASHHWSLYFDETSPYPVVVRTPYDRHGEGVPHDLPAVARRQEATLWSRGTLDPGWRAETVRPVDAPVADDPGFLLGDRLAPPVLDDLVAYPLGSAVSDLMRFRSDFADFIANNPRRVLVAAEHEVTEEAGMAGERHTWRLEFTDRVRGVYGWTISRMSVAGVLLPVPHDHEPTRPTWTPVMDHLAAHPDLVPRLATGQPGAAALRAQGIEHVDMLSYRLALLGTAAVGGTLEAADYRAQDHPEAADAYGHFVQDLATRHVVEFGRTTAP